MKKIYIDYYVEEDELLWQDYKKEIYLMIQKLRTYYKCKKTIFILLTNSQSMAELNKQYRNIDKDTNVISLEMNDDLCLGEIVFSFNKIHREFQEKTLPNETFEGIYAMIYNSFSKYLFFIVSHGFLHLLGYDHQTEEEETAMNQEQEKLFKFYSRNFIAI